MPEVYFVPVKISSPPVSRSKWIVAGSLESHGNHGNQEIEQTVWESFEIPFFFEKSWGNSWVFIICILENSI